MSLTRRRLWLSISLIVVVVAAVYWRLLESFLLQDEWLGIGVATARGPGFIFQNVDSVGSLLLGKGRVLSNASLYLFWKLFKFDCVPMYAYALGLHLVNTVLVFSLIRYLLRDFLAALIAGLFFGLESVGVSAVAWPAASLGTLPATTLLLVGLFSYFRSLGGANFLKTDRLDKRWLAISFGLIYSSLHFKEIGIFLFGLLPVLTWLIRRAKLKVVGRWLMVGVLVAVVVAAVRLGELKSIGNQQELFVTGASQNFYQVLAARAISYPLTSFSLIYFPVEPMIYFSRNITNFYYPFVTPENFVLVSQTVVLDLVAIGLSGLMGIGLILLGIRGSNTTRVLLGFGVSFVLMSFLPYVVVSKNLAYLESRYYYLGWVGAALILGVVVQIVRERLKVVSYLVIGLLAILLLAHGMTIKQEIAAQAEVSQERIRLLNNLKAIKPTLTTAQNIFLVEGSREYYLPGNPLPFQQGLGYTLMVWYFDSGQIPAKLLDEGFLFELNSQGYRQVGDRGFGFYTDRQQFLNAVRENKLPKQTQTQLYYDGRKQRLSVVKP